MSSNGAKYRPTQRLYEPLAKRSPSRIEPEKGASRDQILKRSYACWNLLHIGDCLEWNQEKVCGSENNGRLCGGSTGLLVTARTEGADPSRPEFWKIYSQRENRHAEGFVVLDEELASFAAKERGCVVTIYTRRQPCHFSSDRSVPDSCCEAIVDWYLRRLVPYGARLRILCSDLYRAHWDQVALFGDKQSEIAPASENAREGMRTILRLERASRGGITLSAFESSDWKIVETWLDQKTLTRAKSDEYAAQRKRHDENIARFLDRLRSQL